MRWRKKRRFKSRHNKKRALICFFVAAVVALLAIIDLRLRSVVRVYAQSVVERKCLEAINYAADNAIEQSGITYNDIMKLERDENNCVTAVMADVSLVNKIKTKTTQELLMALGNVEAEQVCVPLGTITGSDFLVGRGPDIRVKTQLTGSSEVEIRSVFESAGINQTRHTVTMDIRCRVYIVMLGTESAQEICLTVPIAETIIVGTVPNTFFNHS